MKKWHITLQITAIKIHQGLVSKLEFPIVILHRYPQISHKDSTRILPRNNSLLEFPHKATFTRSLSMAKFSITNELSTTQTFHSYLSKCHCLTFWSLSIGGLLRFYQKSTIQTSQVAVFHHNRESFIR